MKNDVSEARKNWNCGKEMNFLCNGEEDVVLYSLQALEARDSIRRKKDSIFDYVNN